MFCRAGCWAVVLKPETCGQLALRSPRGNYGTMKRQLASIYIMRVDCR